MVVSDEGVVAGAVVAEIDDETEEQGEEPTTAEGK